MPVMDNTAKRQTVANANINPVAKALVNSDNL